MKKETGETIYTALFWFGMGGWLMMGFRAVKGCGFDEKMLTIVECFNK